MDTSGAVTAGTHIPAYILDDLCARFIINIPEEESRDPIRIFFQIELAHWFYLDFYCPENPKLRSCSIKEFSTQIFRHCPSLAKHVDEFDSILESWKEYKLAVPTYGAILLDPSLQYCLLVQGYWAKASWGFPKGKVNKDESPVDCATREVLEETGFDIEHLVNHQIYVEHRVNEQLSRLYIVPGVSMETKFKARTRNEIKSFEWFRVDHLPSHKKDASCKQNTGLSPNAFFMVIPFMKDLRRFINNPLGFVSDGSGMITVQSSSSLCDGLGGQPAGESTTPRGSTGSRQNAAKDNKSRAAAYDSKMRQKVQFAQQMQLEFQEYMGHREFRKSAAAASNSAVASNQDRSRSESVSPRRPVVQFTPWKQVQILKREVGKSGKSEQKLSAQGLPNSDVSSPGPAEQINADRSDPAVNAFTSPTIWTGFRLNVDSILEAMFPTASHAQPHHQHGRSGHHSRPTQGTKTA